MTLARRAFDHRADLLAAMVYLCLAYLSFNALADYANGHHLFPEPWGGYAFAVAIDGSVLYAFISFRRAQIMAGVLLVAGAATTYMLQRWHAQNADHPLVVAGVVPGLMILVTFAWHRIREVLPEEVPATRLGPPVGSPGLEVALPVSQVSQRPNGDGFTPAQRRRIEGWVAEERSASWMARELGLSDRARKDKLGPLVRNLKAAQVGGPGPNGAGP